VAPGSCAAIRQETSAPVEDPEVARDAVTNATVLGQADAMLWWPLNVRPSRAIRRCVPTTRTAVRDLGTFTIGGRRLIDQRPGVVVETHFRPLVDHHSFQGDAVIQLPSGASPAG
jgi:hypothetical protein